MYPLPPLPFTLNNNNATETVKSVIEVEVNPGLNQTEIFVSISDYYIKRIAAP